MKSDIVILTLIVKTDMQNLCLTVRLSLTVLLPTKQGGSDDLADGTTILASIIGSSRTRRSPGCSGGKAVQRQPCTLPTDSSVLVTRSCRRQVQYRSLLDLCMMRLVTGHFVHQHESHDNLH